MIPCDQPVEAPPTFAALELALEAKVMDTWDEFLMDLGDQIHEDPVRNALLNRVVELVLGVQALIDWNAGIVLAVIGCETTVEDDPAQTYSAERLHVAISRLEQVLSVLSELSAHYSPAEAREAVGSSTVGFGFLFQRKYDEARAWARLGPRTSAMTPAQVRVAVARVCDPTLPERMRRFAASVGSSSGAG